MRDSHRQGPPQRFQGASPVADNRLIRYREAADLGPAAVVALDRGHVDAATGVRHQLGARRGDLAQVRPDGVQQGRRRRGVDRAALGLHLAPHESEPVLCPGQLRAVRDGDAGLTQRVDERLVPRTPEWTTTTVMSSTGSAAYARTAATTSLAASCASVRTTTLSWANKEGDNKSNRSPGSSCPTATPGRHNPGRPSEPRRRSR
ncbi:MAG: hypothetical protein WKF47_13140 [Geodermatophilaceae bacterium]